MIKQFVWDNFPLVKNMFPEKTARRLQSLREEGNQAAFFASLDLVFELSDEIVHALETERVKRLNIQEIAELLHVSAYDSFVNKVKYIPIAEAKIADNESDSVDMATLIHRVALLKYEMARYAEAQPLFEKALHIRETLLGKEHPETAESYHGLATLFRRLGDYQKAQPLFEKALRIREAQLGEEHPETAASYHGLALLYDTLGDYQKAQPLFEKALHIRETHLGEEHPETATSYNDLAVLFRRMGDYQKAQSLVEKALHIRKTELGEEHPETARSYQGLSDLFDTLKDYQKAKPLVEKALHIRETVLGEEHPDTAQSYNDLATLFYWLGDYQKAQPLYKRALRIRETLLGKEHPETAANYSNLAALFYTLRDYQKAQPLYEQALRIRETLLGEEHRDTAMSYNNLAVLLDTLGEYQKAQPIYEKAFTAALKVLSCSNTDVVVYYRNLLKLARKTDRTFFPDAQIPGWRPVVETVTIENFKLLKNFEMRLSPHINIIIGENSSGKTSLLQAMTLALLQENYLGEVNDYERYLTKGKDKAAIRLGFGEYAKTVTVQANKREIENTVLSPFVLAYGANIFTRYELKVDDLVTDIVEGKIVKGFTTSIFQDYTNEFYNPKSILNALVRIEDDAAREIETIFVGTINAFLDDFQLTKEGKGRYVFRHSDETFFKLENLSEGYRNNILLIGDILVRILGVGKRPATVEGVILIDEFDRHLHPKWQMSVVSRLAEIFPKIQFILTTHNPMSILDREPHEITVLRTLNGEVVAKRESGTKKIDVGTTLLKYFNVDSLVGKSMQKNLERLVELKLDGDLDAAKRDELEALEETLDETVATNFIYNRAYFNFLLFLKAHEGIDFRSYENMRDDAMRTLMQKFRDQF